ncbi:MAG: hypothetical protein SF182_06945 [Deltaproteobacteria bacterium]|nr:hypothetical protein [Deltaproteobacteria bacterium]
MRTIASRYIAHATAGARARRVCGPLTLAMMAAAWLSMYAAVAEAEITSVATDSALTYDLQVPSGGATATAQTVSVAPNVFTARFGFNLYHLGLLGTGGTPVDTANADYTTTFSVLSSGNYDMTVTVYRAGELRREHLDPFVVSCGVDLAPMAAPLLTLNAVEPGPALADITLPGASIALGSDDTAVELAEGSRSQTISFRHRPTRDDFSLLLKMAAETTVNTSACEIAARLGVLRRTASALSAPPVPIPALATATSTRTDCSSR